MKNITKIQLGKNGPLVSKLGLGCMRMSSILGSPSPYEAESMATIHNCKTRSNSLYGRLEKFIQTTALPKAGL
ncbi:hypothetical protein A0256_19620 [Mucilaginibacter sp. PAMC 26640]|nr:hypothetical protein A0256_19620 [Mucilaginibacter sp. PAMC 26640]